MEESSMARSLALLLALCFIAAAPAAFAASHAGAVKWLTPDAGFAKAKAENKKIMLYFSADW
jgi:hypothetical protein